MKVFPKSFLEQKSLDPEGNYQHLSYITNLMDKCYTPFGNIIANSSLISYSSAASLAHGTKRYPSRLRLVLELSLKLLALSRTSFMLLLLGLR